MTYIDRLTLYVGHGIEPKLDNNQILDLWFKCKFIIILAKSLFSKAILKISQWLENVLMFYRPPGNSSK